MKAVVTIMTILFFGILPAGAQNYFRGEQTVIQPLQVMIDNFTTIPLAKETIDDPNANRFDKYNAYTYLQLIHDNSGMNYHVLFQSNFSGKILFLACSNNLSNFFNNNIKPLNVFVNCIKQVNDHLSGFQNADAVVKCMVDRLNYCGN